MDDNQKNSRTEFICQVAKSISDAQDDDSRTESFVFGLSAKWGEGKTTFLNQLKDELIDTEVVEINPWKYGDNKATFLQSFLIEMINKLSGKKMINELLVPGKKSKITKDDILQTKTFQKINWDNIVKKTSVWVWFVVYLILVFGIQFIDLIPIDLIPIDLIPIDLIKDNNEILKSCLQIVITVLYGAFLIPLFTKTSTYSVSDFSSSALINFDDNLEEIIKSYCKSKKKIVVYVDDLDRVSSKNAISVLDSLRTFFDKKELCFVVSGDHSVIERHIGRELVPGGSDAECLEEGRRYLKKIFNIYFRLPIPINSEIENYVSNQLENNLSEFNFTEEEKDQLSYMLNELFDNNYRNIERMVSQIAFTLRIVKAKLDGCKDETKIYYKDLLKHKILLIKVLLIQELANPYYEYLLKNYDYLRKSDKGKLIFYEESRYGNSGEIPSIFSKDQFNALEFLITEEPKFYIPGEGLVVRDMKPFIYLAADASFGDNRGLLPSEFDKTLYESLSNINELKSLLDRHSITMLRDGIKAMFDTISKKFERNVDIDQIEKDITILVARLEELGEDYSDQKSEFNKFFDIDFLSRFINTKTYPEFLQIFGVYSYENSLCQDDSIEPLLAYNSIVQFNSLIEYANSLESISPLYSKVLWGCFDKFYSMHYNQFINNFNGILDKLPSTKMSADTLNNMAKIIETLYNKEVCVASANALAKTGDTKAIDNVVDKMAQNLKNNTRRSMAISILESLDKSRLDDYLKKEVLAGINNSQTLIQRLKFAIDNGLNKDDLWKYIIDNKLDVLLGCITLLNSQTYQPLESPSSDIAKLIAQKFIMYIKEKDQRNLLSMIEKRNYLFKNLDSIKGEKVVTMYLNKLAKSIDEADRNNANRILGIGS